MKHMYLITMIACAGAANAQSFFLDFEDLGSGTVVTDQYASSSILFGTDATDTEDNDILTNSGLEISGLNTLRSVSDGTLSFSFTTAVSSVEFFAISVEDASGVSYYRDGNLLFEDIRAGTGDFFIPQFFAFSDALGIDHVVVNGFDGAAGDPFVIDDLSYTLVPAPTTTALLTTAALTLTRRRRN